MALGAISRPMDRGIESDGLCAELRPEHRGSTAGSCATGVSWVRSKELEMKKILVG
jgi:hypothetical protein